MTPSCVRSRSDLGICATWTSVGPLSSTASVGKENSTPHSSNAIEAADSKARLEDLYLPYRPKRRTKAQIAREAGLEPLAEALLARPDQSPEQVAGRFVEPSKGVIDYGLAIKLLGEDKKRAVRSMPARRRNCRHASA